jgi:hypothetical protein
MSSAISPSAKPCKASLKFDPKTCDHLSALYPQAEPFRSQVIMARHDVSRLRSGNRHTLGIIFHDAS